MNIAPDARTEHPPAAEVTHPRDDWERPSMVRIALDLAEAGPAGLTDSGIFS
ncbi:hypothetical protein [Zavarzinia sp. CC-PAN008]|uniref:hypothetical protein n=1 Tax=Zavarzinia sp. CC-PAN008 TaxID=3243332 RepID=UPI003F7458C3